jgi:hypothetical protein
MAEVSAPRGVNPAHESTALSGQNNPNRIAGSVLFRELLQGHSACPNLVNGPMSWRHGQSKLQTGPEGHSRVPERRVCRDPSDGLDSGAEPAPPPTLDPLICQLAMNQGPSSAVQLNPGPSPASATPPLREDLQNLLTGLARRSAWGGDRRKGSARIELAEGALAGATLHVHTEQRTVSVELELPPGMPAHRWQERIAARLEGRGFTAEVRVG